MGQRSRQRRLLFGIIGLMVALLLGQTVISSSRWLNRSFAGFFVHENLTVGPYSLPGWSGEAAGLRSLDRIVSIDGRNVRDRDALYEHARKLAPGTPVRYQISRDDRQLDIVAPTKLFLLSDWLLSFGIYVLIGLAFLAIGGLPYIYRAPSPVALPLCFMVMAVFVWFETTFDFMTEGRLPKELRIFALCLTPSAAIHLALLLRHSSSSAAPQRLVVVALYGMGVVVAGLNSASYFGSVEVWRQFYRLAYGYVFLGALAFLVITANALKRTDSDLERSRLRVMLVGALAGFLIPAFTTVLTSTLQLAIPYNLALLPTVFFPISVAYALLKYRLFELGHALKFALSRVALLAVMILLYGVVALAVAPLAGESVRDPLVMTFFSLLIVMLFNPLLRRFESVIDRFIYRQDYDPAAVQSQVSLFLRSLAAPPALAKGFLERIVDPLGIKTASVLFREKDAPRWLSVLSDGQVLLENGDGISLSRLWEGKDYAAICRAEVALDPRFEGKQNEILLLCERSKAEIMLPLVFENELRGVISLGVKRAGREYSANDFRLLGTLAEQLTLSLENGRLYQESEAAREKAEASNRKLIEMDRVKKDFVANICHEIRTPVSTIIGFAEILRDPGYQGESRAILDRLVNNGQELSGLMDNLMNYSRMEADGSASRCETVNLKELFTGLAIVTGRLIRGRPIEFGAHVETTFAAIESDAQKLQQILVELLTNAVKFTKQGRVELTARDGGEPGLLEFAVADTGIGIRCEDQKLIFEDFRQLDGSSTRQYGGTGVGLGLCKKFAASLGGEIQVASELGIGSVFKLILPASAAHSAAVRRAA